ncbi:putative ABC transporter, substrate binding protein [Cellvibrio japonicus Ueda107]|uniref:Putative ABC transporter, substrate binding protein n=2 Tax=Cellvibrio japonicus TaxID=155077 RepID=B3PJW2_CELJU|nr:putative ABC transporter, substrate binding protein [Cellvibrio japonicus Ueda107]QEI12741.1 nitrate ABC transporter substrate-binding protein [Cellvibrio japonicus]QEI16315.1 nitrate ABC transporter substrate-binding protein [Cellvibrio japonicus]QEI19893.1 nitrate ABC transporter substrate-binding protein [Cellvibrio japonicus]
MVCRVVWFFMTFLKVDIARLWFAVFIIVVLARSVCASAAEQVLRVAVVANASSGELTFAGIPQVVARDELFREALAKHKYRIEWIPVSTAAVATLVNESFASGKIDFAFYGDLPSLILNASGISTRLIVPGSVGNNTYLVVPQNSIAKTIRDLKGKRIALHRGRPWEATFAKLVAAEGLTLRDFRIMNLNPQAGAAAVSAGNVDGFFTLSDAHALTEKGVGKIIWSTKVAPVSWRMRAELWGSKSFVDTYPEITQLLATATVRAVHWVSQPENQDAYIREQARMGLPESLIRLDILDDNISWKNYWSPLVGPDLLEHYRDLNAYARSARLIRKPVAAEELIEAGFVSVAIQALGLEHYWPVPVEANE